MVYASIVAVTLCIADGVVCLAGFLGNNKTTILATQFVCVMFDMTFLAIWGYALVTLN